MVVVVKQGLLTNMDPQQLAGSNIPPQALAALQQQQAGGTDITAILAQLAEMSPDEVAAALQQLGINVDPNTLHDAAAQWVEQAGDKQTSSSSSSSEEQPPAPAPAAESEGEEDAPTATASPSPPIGDDEAAEVAEGAPDDESAEGEDASDMATPGQAAGGAVSMPRAGGNSRGAPPNSAPIAGRRGGGMNMDALISAALSQGDPSSMPPPMRPPGGAGAQMRGPTMPTAPTAPTAAGEDPRARAMIASIYRDAASKPQRTSTRAASLPPVASRRR
jgi:hypothetical protein